MRRYFAVLLLLVLISACNSAPVRRVTPPVTPEQPAEQTIRLLTLPDFPTEHDLDSVIAAFVEQYPHYKIERVPMGSRDNWPDDPEIQRAMLEGKVDVVPVNRWNGEYTQASLSIDHYILKSGFDLSPFGPGLERHRIDGRMHYLPYRLLPVGILGNADSLAAAGVALPQSAWTWDQFRLLANGLKSQKQGQPVWGMVDMPVEQLFRIWVEGQGDRPAWQATDRELIDGLQFFRAMIDLDRSLQPPPVRRWQMDGIAEPMVGWDAWLSGRAVLTGGVFMRDLYEQVGVAFPVAFAPMPSHSGRRPASLAVPFCLTISSGSKVPDAAWEFVRFAAGLPGAKILAGTGVLPMYGNDEVKQAWFGQSPPPPAMTETFFQTHWFLFGEDWEKEPGALDAPMSYALYRLANRVLAQNMDPGEAVALFHKDVAEVEKMWRPR